MHGIVTDITDIIVYNWYGCVRHSLVYIWHETELPDCQIWKLACWFMGPTRTCPRAFHFQHQPVMRTSGMPKQLVISTDFPRWHRQASCQWRWHCATGSCKTDAVAQLLVGSGEVRSWHPPLWVQVAWWDTTDVHWRSVLLEMAMVAMCSNGIVLNFRAKHVRSLIWYFLPRLTGSHHIFLEFVFPLFNQAARGSKEPLWATRRETAWQYGPATPWTRLRQGLSRASRHLYCLCKRTLALQVTQLAALPTIYGWLNLVTKYEGISFLNLWVGLSFSDV